MAGPEPAGEPELCPAGGVAADPVAATTAGPVRGLNDGAVLAFKGIPYAGPAGGTNRFVPPTPVERWVGTRDARSFGLRAPQQQTRTDTELHRLLQTPGYEEEPSGEDCLVLNVWTPALDTGRRPVLVWLHGGGFTGGSGSIPVCRGDTLAARSDVVAVTVNHRLGLLGYLHLAGLVGDRYAGSGNVGMLDLVAALRWVRDNILGFGGDPGNVTIFGESGGGMKVSYLLAMPSARGLFQRAVIQSGPGLEAKPENDATELARSALRRLGIAPTDAESLATVPVERLIEVQLEEEEAHANADVFRRVSLERNPMLFTWQPVRDGVVLPEHPVASRALAESPDVPVLIGSNVDELSFMGYEDPRFGRLERVQLQALAQGWFGSESERVLGAYARARPDATPTELWTAILTDGIMWSGSIELAERRAGLARAPVFMYLFTYETPVLGSSLKSVHGLELPFVFHALDRYPMAGDRGDRFALADLVSEAWVRFARTGNPGHAGLPDWPAYSSATRSTMILDVRPTVVDDPSRELRELWLARTTSFEGSS